MQEFRSLFDLTGRTAVVVGAASGIGQAAAHGLAAFGARVVCADTNLGGARETASRIEADRGQAIPIHIDITDPDSIEAALLEVGTPDALVTTPSINVRKPIVDIDDDAFDDVVGLNLKGTFRLLREFGRCMAERGRGSIVVFSSIRATVVEPGQGVYAATKAGTVLLARTLAAELGERGVRVNAVAPGVVETPLTEQIKQHPSGTARMRTRGRSSAGRSHRSWPAWSSSCARTRPATSQAPSCTWTAAGWPRMGASSPRCRRTE